MMTLPPKITIFGAEGTGKSTISKLLAQALSYEVLSSGGMMRETAQEHGMDIYEFGRYLQDNLEIDRALDQKIAAYGRDHSSFVFESRLAWYWIPDAFHIVLRASDDVRMARIAQRENMVIEQAREMTLEREATNQARYSVLYPEMIFPPQDDQFALVIDTDDKTPAEIIELILAYFR